MITFIEEVFPVFAVRTYIELFRIYTMFYRNIQNIIILEVCIKISGNYESLGKQMRDYFSGLNIFGPVDQSFITVIPKEEV